MSDFRINIDQVPIDILLVERPGRPNGVFEPEKGERLTLKKGPDLVDCSGDSASCRDFLRQNNLPNFSGLNLTRWHQTHQAVLSRSTNAVLEAEFASLVNFCRDHHLDLFGITRSLQGLGNVPETRDRLMTLKIACLLEYVVKEDPGGFYTAREEGKRSNQMMIDAVLGKIRAGDLKVKNSQDSPRKLIDNEQSPAIYFTLAYDSRANELQVFRSYPPEDLLSQASFVHEVLHAYRDMTRADISIEEDESSAYIKGMEYLLHHEGLAGPPTKPEQIDALIQRLFGQREIAPLYLKRVWAAHYRLSGLPEYRRLRQEIGLEISNLYIVGPLLAGVFSQIRSRAEALAQTIQQTTQALASRPDAFRAWRQKTLDEYNKALSVRLAQVQETGLLLRKSDRSNATLEAKLYKEVADLYLAWVLIVTFDSFVSQIEDQVFRQGKKEYAISSKELDTGSPEMQWLLVYLYNLGLFSYIKSRCDGIGSK